MKQVIYFIGFALIFIFSLITNWYAALGITLALMLVVIILNKIGNGIVLLEMTAFMYVFTCIIMPLVGYEYYTYGNKISRLWVSYMMVKPDVYFKFAIPAITAFCMAVLWPVSKRRLPDEGDALKEKIAGIRQLLSKDKNKGLQIVLTGIGISFVSRFLPVSFTYFAILFFFGSFAGLLYIHFSLDFRHKKKIMLLFGIFILWNALQTGMFTIVAYMGITIFSFFRLGSTSSMLRKVVLMFITVAFFVVLQNVKVIYRKQTWNKKYEGNKVELFSNLFIENVEKGNALLSENALFPLYSRTNQGFNIALVMKRIPVIQPYDYGDRLLTVFASAFVPRFLWTDKPEAGGKFNMKYYAGWSIKGWSTNVGPMGEAYGSFGVTGAIIYIFLLGLFLRWAYIRVFVVSDKIPLLICWLPVLFYMTTSSAETDTLQILNSIIKSAFFIWLLTKLLPGWFGIVKQQAVKKFRLKKSLA